MASTAQVEYLHSLKRKAADSLETEQRLAKRFNLLNLENDGNKLYIPISARDQRQPSKATNQSRLDNDFMQVEDTKDKVYVYNLDEELAESDSEQDRLVFIPDIEKHLTTIPRHILTGQKPPQSNELVLYSDPSSLSVPREHDSVRKAIIEVRHRARQQQAEQLSAALNGFPSQEGHAPFTADGSVAMGQTAGVAHDTDMMDIG